MGWEVCLAVDGSVPLLARLAFYFNLNKVKEVVKNIPKARAAEGGAQELSPRMKPGNGVRREPGEAEAGLSLILAGALRELVYSQEEGSCASF